MPTPAEKNFGSSFGTIAATDCISGVNTALARFAWIFIAAASNSRWKWTAAFTRLKAFSGVMPTGSES